MVTFNLSIAACVAIRLRSMGAIARLRSCSFLHIGYRQTSNDPSTSGIDRYVPAEDRRRTVLPRPRGVRAAGKPDA